MGWRRGKGDVLPPLHSFYTLGLWDISPGVAFIFKEEEIEKKKKVKRKSEGEKLYFSS